MKNNQFPKVLLITMLVVSSILYTNAQITITQTIRGRITDKLSQIPLPGVNVIIETTNPQTGTSTDVDGYFRIDNIPVGRHNIKISCM